MPAHLLRSVVAGLDALLEERRAERPGITRQNLLREAVSRYLAGEQRKARKRHAAEEGRG